MIPLKTKKEIKIMQEGGKRLRSVLAQVLAAVKPGVKTIKLDTLAEKLILEAGGQPSFKMVPGYCFATCITLNEEVVHGLPGEKKIGKDDKVGIDIGIYYQGFHTDVATTIKLKNGKPKDDDFLKVGRRALHKAIREVRVGHYLGQASLVIQETIEKAGYSPVRSLTGHGVGRILHEEPVIPCFLAQKLTETEKIQVGMTFAIEVIYNEGTPGVYLASDGWTIKTKDGKISGLFEETVAVTENGPLVLTQ